jgi:hypothetical protein
MLSSLLTPLRYLGLARAQAAGTRPSSDSRICWRTYSYVQRYNLDPEFRRQELDRNAEYVKLRKTRDPQFREKRKVLNRTWMQQRRTDQGYLRSAHLSLWVRTAGWHRADLPWKKYRPELSSERVMHHCSGCNVPDFKSKLWWTSVSEAQSYLCGRCWLKLSWVERCPRDFEDTATWREFIARAKELGIAKP